MKQNLGKVDRVLRFALAVWWLGTPWAPHFGADWANMIIAVIGWIALVESFWGWCWIHTFLKIDNQNQ